ncbi:Rv3235 family protein [Gordonia insulae]|uniref:Uncharacterized protein n=1 Tax=Gordonia insulae TaxID=2420509 RepID=A0A3G8JU50_9ACTN|nr:Rv3235 family protein [Gordonia insulae]AZG48453.1 hypothetical protein D7316_05070 [Gordonia insulae]
MAPGPPAVVSSDAPRAAGSPVTVARGASPRALAVATTEARRFSIGTLTLLLEIIDRRRGLNQLEAHAPAHLLEQVATLVRMHDSSRRGSTRQGSTRQGSTRGGASSVHDNAATLRRVHIQMCGPGAAEIFGSYRRGERVRAFAARIEQMPCRVRSPRGQSRVGLSRMVEYRWQLVAFTLV